MAVWPANRWLRLTKEATWGTFDAAAPAGDILWIRLVEGAFVLDSDPKRWLIRSADGGNLKTQQGSRRIGFTGSLRTPLYPTQAIKLVTWALPTGSGNSIALPSFTADYQSGYEVRRHTGVRIGKLTAKSDDESDNAMLDLELVAKDQSRGSVTLAEPAVTVFPNETPYHHGELSGQVSIGGARTGIRDFAVEITNRLYVRFHESSRVDRINYRGRDVALTATLADPTGADKTSFEAQAAIAVSAGWTRTSPAHNVTFNLQAANFLGRYAETGTFDEDLYEAIMIDSLRDPSSGVDLAVTAA